MDNQSNQHPLLTQLNPQQAEAVRQTEGPVLVLAGAGSGKTRTLTHRAAYLLKEQGVSPENVLMVTFTNKAAEEMAERVKKLLNLRENIGRYSAHLPVMGTFHSVCVRILRRDIEWLGWNKNFLIYDDQDQKTLLKQILKELGISSQEIKPGAVLQAISAAKNKLWQPTDYHQTVENYRQELVARCFQLYEQKMRQAGALDFDDLLLKTVELFQKFPEILSQYQQQWRYLMVDEYQDTNQAQYKFLKLLAQEHRNICVVGDDYQSIYRWRGAEVTNILNFEKDYPGARVILLEQNYRSTQTILKAAEKVIVNNRCQKHKKLWTDNPSGEPIGVYRAGDEEAEADFVAGEVERLQKEEKIPPREIAVLYRTNAQSRALEEAFMRRGLPYRLIGGVKFYQRQEVKNILAYLFFVFNPRDRVSFQRIINLPRRGLGAKTVDTILQAAENQDIITALEKIIRKPAVYKIPPKKAQVLQEFVSLVKKWRQFAQDHSPRELIEKIYRESGYRQALAAAGDEGAARQENILELLTVAAEYEAVTERPEMNSEQREQVAKQAADTAEGLANASGWQSLQNFLEDVALVSQTDRDLQEQEATVLLTMHSAKGLEFKAVFIVGLEEGLFPHANSSFNEDDLEEERRLCYVALTRAREKLFLTHTRQRSIYGSTQQAVPSRFLEEIDDESLLYFYNETEEALLPVDFQATTKSRANQFCSPRPATKSRDPLSAKRKAENKAENLASVTGLGDGDKVWHEIFGRGLIVSSDQETFTVFFEKNGMKKLAKEVVRLKKRG